VLLEEVDSHLALPDTINQDMQYGVFGAHISVHIPQYTEVQRLCKKTVGAMCTFFFAQCTLKCAISSVQNKMHRHIVIRYIHNIQHCVKKSTAIFFYTAQCNVYFSVFVVVRCDAVHCVNAFYTALHTLL
jgi:hypothetical protein